MIRTSRRLADGREILYFGDDAHPAEHTARDARHLPPVSTRSQLRFDALVGEWVAIASHRQTRTFLPPEIPDSAFQVVVFENRFPSAATAVDRDVPPHAPGAPTAPLRPGYGRCEVGCFTDDHQRTFADLGPERGRLA